MTNRFKIIKCEIDPSDKISLRPEQGWLVMALLSCNQHMGGVSIGRDQIDELIDYLQDIKDEIAE